MVQNGSKDKHSPIAGMLWMSAATFFFAISFTLVKALQDDGLTVYQAVFFRQTLGIAIFFPMLIQGLAGVSRRLADGGQSYAHAQSFIHYNEFMSISAWLLGLAQLPFIINIVLIKNLSLKKHFINFFLGEILLII